LGGKEKDIITEIYKCIYKCNRGNGGKKRGVRRGINK